MYAIIGMDALVLLEALNVVKISKYKVKIILMSIDCLLFISVCWIICLKAYAFSLLCLGGFYLRFPLHFDTFAIGFLL